MNFTVSEKQMERFRRWVRWLAETHDVGHDTTEEQCVVSPPWVWTFQDMGITTMTKVAAYGHTLDLTLDDDGDFIENDPTLAGRPCCGRKGLQP